MNSSINLIKDLFIINQNKYKLKNNKCETWHMASPK